MSQKLQQAVENLHLSLSLDNTSLSRFIARGGTYEQLDLFRVGLLTGDNFETLPPDLANWVTHNVPSFMHGAEDPRVYTLPLTSPDGHIRGIQFRDTDQTVKGYQMYSLPGAASVFPILFGLAQAMPTIYTSGRLLIVEGAFDLFPVQRVFPGSLSTLTASISTVFRRWVLRLVRQLFVFYDNDRTGNVAFQRLVEMFDNTTVTVSRVAYTRGMTQKDPADIFCAHGLSAISSMLSECGATS